MHESVRNILIPNLLRVGARNTVSERRDGLRGSGCVCAGGRGPSGASSSSRAARQRSSSPSASAPCLRSTDAPGRSLVSPEVGGRKDVCNTNPTGRLKCGWSQKSDRFRPRVYSFMNGEPHRHAWSWGCSSEGHIRGDAGWLIEAKWQAGSPCGKADRNKNTAPELLQQ